MSYQKGLLWELLPSCQGTTVVPESLVTAASMLIFQQQVPARPSLVSSLALGLSDVARFFLKDTSLSK